MTHLAPHRSMNLMHGVAAIVAAVSCIASISVAAQPVFSWDPLKDIENALPEGVASEGKIIQGRQQVREMAQDAVATLIEYAPGTHRALDRAAGYAVFSTFGVKLFLAGGTAGKGVVINQRTHRQTFMKMVQVQGGLGFAINQNRLIFAYTTEQALRNFIDQGWGFGGQANPSAIAGGKGGTMSGAAAVAPNVYLYQLTNLGHDYRFGYEVLRRSGPQLMRRSRNVTKGGVANA